MRCFGLWCSGRDGGRALGLAGKCSAPNSILPPAGFLPEDDSCCQDLISQRQFYWSLREKHNIGGNPARRQEMEESHAFQVWQGIETDGLMKIRKTSPPGVEMGQWAKE